MDLTYVPPERQGLLFLYSLVLGYIIGVLCGSLRLPACVLKNIVSNNKKICIIIDILFDIMLSIVNIIVIITFIYAANEGVIRFYMLLITFLGILLYKISLGKLQNMLAASLSKLIRKITVFIIKIVRKLIYPLKEEIISLRVMGYIKRGISSAGGR